MTNDRQRAIGTSLRQGGEEVRVSKVPDRFAVRLKRGVSPRLVEDSYRAEHRRSIERQGLEEFAVDALERDRAMDRVRAGDEAEFATHVYQFANDPASRVYLTDEITVQFAPEAGEEAIEQICAEFGLEPVKAVPGVPGAHVFRLTPQATENPIKIANRLLARPGVLTSEPNIVVPAQTFYVPTDTLFPEQWHLHHSGGPLLAAASHIDAVRAWDLTRGARSVVVAVADDSCDLNHDDFGGEGKIVAPRDFAGRDFSPLPEGEADNHGTACAGVAVADENGRGVVGVAPGCALMPIRTSGMLDDNAIEELFGWVTERGAAVVSCSWGPAAIFFPLSLRKRNALHRAATLGRGGRGCVIVFAAGNANRPVDGTVDERGWPNNLLAGPTRWLNGFAAHEDVIAVAACTSLAAKSAYSNWGREIAVCAPSNNAHPGISYPGVGPTRTYPRITAPIVGRGVVTADRVGPSGYDSTDYTRSFGGTSSACPVVVGVAALVLSANPDLTAREVRAILEATADKITDPATDPQLGNAFGTYDANGHSQWFGHGRVNAFAAVTEALRRRQPAAGRRFVGAATPALEVPDNDPAGIRSTVTFAEAARVAAIGVAVDIAHTYIGDLRLTLTAPSGARVVLHDRNGGGADNLRRTFDPATTPALATLAGQPLGGDWTLHVQDLAPVDIGRLDRWELAIDARPDTVIELGDTPGAAIPDNAPQGIERTLTVAETGRVREVSLAVDITHTYIGDLVATLTSPAGTVVTLHGRAGGGADNLITTYTPATTPGLQGLRGEAVGGAWRLKVADLERLDRGKLNRWALRIVCEP